MKGFLRFAGVIEFVLYIAGIIVYAINIPLVGVNIFYFVLLIVLGPTIAVLLFAVAQILENTEVNESKLDKLNKKVDLLVDKLVDDSSFKENSDDKSTLTAEEKKRYKDQIQSICHQFPFYKCSSSIKDKASDLVIESNESINKAVTKEEAEKAVQDFEKALEELKQ